MNRMAILCAVLVVGLTTVVLVEHRRGDAGDAPADAPNPADPPAASAAAAGPAPGPTTDVVPAIDLGALRARIANEVVTPLAEGWTRRLSFSRVRQPSPDLHLRMQPSERDPRPDDGDRFVYFAIDQTPNRHPREERAPRPWMRGRVARDGGIELAYARAGAPDAIRGPWQPAVVMIERLSGNRP